jgi:hypothetical protein
LDIGKRASRHTSSPHDCMIVFTFVIRPTIDSSVLETVALCLVKLTDATFQLILLSTMGEETVE